MAIDKKIKNNVLFFMETLGIDYDDWLNEQHKSFMEEKNDEFIKKVSGLRETIKMLQDKVNEQEKIISEEIIENPEIPTVDTNNIK